MKNQQQQFIFVCHGKDCKKEGCKALQQVLKSELKQKRQQKALKIIKTKCTGKCKQAPVMIAQDQWMTRVDVAKVREVVEKMLPTDKVCS